MDKPPCNPEAVCLPARSLGAADPVIRKQDDAPRTKLPTLRPSPSTNYDGATVNDFIVDPSELDDLEALSLPPRRLNINPRHNQNQPCKTVTNTPWPPNSDDIEKSVLTPSSDSPEVNDVAGGLLGRDMLDALSLHQSLVRPSLDIISSDVEHLQRHGPKKYTLHLVVQMETKLGMSLEGSSLEERIRYLKESRPPKDHETLLRPTLARKPHTRTNTWTRPEKEFDVYTWILACRGFRILRSETPPHMNLTDLLRTLAVNFARYSDIPDDVPTQNALLACGLLHHVSLRKLPVQWDITLLVSCGSHYYGEYILGRLGSMVKGRPILSFDEGGLFDKILEHYLKKYETLEAEFSSRPIPEGMTALSAIALIMRFPEGPLDFVDWQRPTFDTALMVFVAKCLAALGLAASLKAIREDVIKVLMNINWKLEEKWSPPVGELLRTCEEHWGGPNETHNDDEADDDEADDDEADDDEADDDEADDDEADDEFSIDDEFNADDDPILTASENSSKTFGKLEDESPQKINIVDWLQAA
ncbi:hypothetical protein AK830_g5488 [Neonectria ditissima]|uniref:Uncharacterized protein n=1 Tax=Neonectria ditissima TaxID=78410 RepID=A0A0N8H785_9HYPO|nr:hypothetical protein AK830_g5488 [Neonectria ditissima]